MSAYLASVLGSALCIVLGWFTGSWKWLFAILVVVSGAAIFVIVNDGWYGHGWGDFGVTMSWLEAAFAVSVTAGAIALRRHRGR